VLNGVIPLTDGTKTGEWTTSEPAWERSVAFVAPSVLQPSVNTDLILVNYSLEVDVEISMANTVTLSVPVVVALSLK